MLAISMASEVRTMLQSDSLQVVKVLYLHLNRISGHCIKRVAGVISLKADSGGGQTLLPPFLSPETVSALGP